jgi:hypothetical protein
VWTDRVTILYIQDARDDFEAEIFDIGSDGLLVRCAIDIASVMAEVKPLLRYILHLCMH